MSSYHSHYDEKHLIGNLLSDQDDSFLLHSSESSQSSTKEHSTATVTSSNAVGRVASEFNSAWPEPPPPYSPSTLFLPPPPGLPVSTWRETPHHLREENVVDDWSSFLAKKTPSYSSLTERGSTQCAPLTAPAHNDNSMPFSYRDAVNRGSGQSMAMPRLGSSSCIQKEGEKNVDDSRMKSSNEEVNQDTKSWKGTSSESRDSFQQITRKKGQQKMQNVNGDGKSAKTRSRPVNVSELLDPPPIEDNSRFTILDKLASRRNTWSFSEDEGSIDCPMERTPMHSTLTKNEKKWNTTNGSGMMKKKWMRKDEKDKGMGIINNLTLILGLMRMAFSYSYTVASSLFSYVYELVVDFVVNLIALIRYGIEGARMEVRVKMHEIRGKASEWWNKKKEEEAFGLVHNIRMPETGDQALERLIHARGQDAYSVLGLRWDENDEVIKSYYKKQALLVHPDKNKREGAEEAFQILSKAFEVVSTPEKRKKYDAERMMSGPLRKEFTELYRVLQVKVEETRNRMECNCGSSHVRVACKLPQQAARYCRKCDTRHAAKNLDLWAESRILGSFWVYYTCVNGVVYEVSAWANCPYNQLKHMRADQHNVQYRMANVVKKEKEQRQSTDRYQRLSSESTEKTTAIHLNGGNNQATLQPVAREDDRPRKARRTAKKK
ncbi:hypothetical protein PMAYCL1PPCAC_07071 [Pristionchus mayeri]|uniref:J domain-containing protein n=1 Tax=Pristionchus mayeri TaxID=1317129 RepID=A0AAN5CCX5_9BILA|nr:hypothetical protein PMAYCL1PPCAC_07071 [Pristionchus mayeri]